MKSPSPIETADLEFDHGTFDSAGFTASALADWESLASILDHTLLKPEASLQQIEKLCADAALYRFASAVVNPLWAATAVSLLTGTGVPVGVVLGFPLGASLVSTLRQEATALMRLGARELHLVIPVGQLKSGNHHAVHTTLHTTINLVHHHGAIAKVILETGLLSTEEKLRASEVAIQAGADFLQTSTGFSAGGTTVADVALMRGVAGSRCGIKALGGVQTLANVRSMLEAGANRIGASSSVAIVRELGAE